MTATADEWITVREAVATFVVPESTLRYSIRKGRIGSRREVRDNREVIVVRENDCANRWCLRPEMITDHIFANTLLEFEGEYPGGDENGLSGKQQYEKAVFGGIGHSDGTPRRISISRILEGAIGNAMGGAAVVGAVAFVNFIRNWKSERGSKEYEEEIRLLVRTAEMAQSQFEAEFRLRNDFAARQRQIVKALGNVKLAIEGRMYFKAISNCDAVLSAIMSPPELKSDTKKTVESLKRDLRDLGERAYFEEKGI